MTVCLCSLARAVPAVCPHIPKRADHQLHEGRHQAPQQHLLLEKVRQTDGHLKQKSKQ